MSLGLENDMMKGNITAMSLYSYGAGGLKPVCR